MAPMGRTPCQFSKMKHWVFINIKKYKIIFKIRKDNLRTIFFLMTNKTSVLRKFTSLVVRKT